MAAGAAAATSTSRTTGNWDTGATWRTTRTGTIGTSTASTNVTGTGTLFTTELAVNDVIMTAGGTVIGTVKSITSDTALVLQANAAVTQSAAYSAQKVPAAADTVNVGTTAAHTVTIAAGVTASAASLTIGNSAVAGVAAVTLAAATSQLNVSGAVVVDDPNNSNTTNALNAGDGTISIGGTLSFGGNGNRRAALTIDAGTVSVSGNIAFSNGSGRIVFTNTGTLNVGAALGAGGTFIAGTGTVVYNGTSAQTVQSAYAYNNLTLSNAAGTSAGGNLTIGGNLTVSAGTFDLGTNTANRSSAGGTLSVAAGATLQIGGTNSMPTNYSTHSFDAASTVEYDGTTQSVTAENYGNLTLTGSGTTKTPAAGTYNIAGTFTVNSGVTVAGNTNNPTINLSGDFVQNGTYNSGTGVFSFTGGAAQTWSGGATTLSNLTINKSANAVTIASGTPSPTVSGTLTLTSGNIVTDGASCGTATPLIISAAGTIAGGSSSSFVDGALRKNFNANSTLNFRPTAGQDEFPVGTAALGYAPIEITAGGTSTAGNITVCVIAGDHPSMSLPNGGGIDITKSANLYWAMSTSTINTLSGTGAALMDATFKYNTNVDGAAITANFIGERWDGSKWSPTTLVVAGGASTEVQNVDISSTTNEFELGEPFASFPPVLGNFNAFDTSAPAGSVLGVIQTKQVGTAFSVRVVRIANNAIDTSYNNTGIQVQLVDASNNSGGYTTGCRSTWSTSIGAVNVNFSSGVATANFPAAQIPNVYRDVRVRVGGGAGCSSDNFAIRPISITADAADADWRTAGTGRTLANASASGGNVHAASEIGAATPRPFTLRITPQAAGGQSASRYDGSPTLVSGYPVCCTPSTSPACSSLPATCTVGSLGFTGGSWTGTGTRTNATAHYSEAGVVNVQFEDGGFAAVDNNDGSSAAARNIPATATASIGRFVPDNFAASALVSPTFLTFNANDASCSAPPSGPKRSFTYVGQPFGFTTAATIRLTARNSAGNTTTNYKGSLWKVGGAGTSSLASDCTTNPNLCAFTTTWSPARGSVGETYSYVLAPASTPNWDGGASKGIAPSVTVNGDGTGDFAFTAGASGDQLAFKRDAVTPMSAFTASISNTVSFADDTDSGTSGNGTVTGSVSLSGIPFDAGNTFRYGALRLNDSFGPVNGNRPVAIQVQYWTGAGFALNTSDNCTSFTEKNFVLYAHNGAITTTNLPTPTAGSNGKVTMGIATVVAGNGRVDVGAPSPAITQPGSARICLDLDSATTQLDTGCIAITPANKSYLQGRWTGANYDKDPNAAVGFGLYGAQPNNFIFFRENF